MSVNYYQYLQKNYCYNFNILEKAKNVLPYQLFIICSFFYQINQKLYLKIFHIYFSIPH